MLGFSGSGKEAYDFLHVGNNSNNSAISEASGGSCTQLFLKIYVLKQTTVGFHQQLTIADGLPQRPLAYSYLNTSEKTGRIKTG